jgi:cytochrome c peroxidase
MKLLLEEGVAKIPETVLPDRCQLVFAADEKMAHRRCLMSKTWIIGFALASLGLSSLGAQAPSYPPLDTSALRSAKQIQLGKFLFRTGKLSLDDTISCASCHDAGHAFADENSESLGVLGTRVGRNSPTLVGIKHIKKFPGIRAGLGRRNIRARALSLAERCLAPIENPIEMGSSIEVAVKKLRAIPKMDERFNEAFGASVMPITGKRIGEALAAFLVSLEIPESRFHEFLRGREDALTKIERRGYQKFLEAGCADCHRGRSLSDGLMHPVLPPNGDRLRAQATRAQEVTRAALASKERKGLEFPAEGLARTQFERSVRGLRPQGGMCGEPARRSNDGYGGQTPGVTIEVQTLPLWNVTATAPYFRDGSEQTLKGALKTHVKELREIQKGWTEVRRTLQSQQAAGQRPPAKLVAKKREWVTKGNQLGALSDLDLLAIEKFLAVLTSP